MMAFHNRLKKRAVYRCWSYDFRVLCSVSYIANNATYTLSRAPVRTRVNSTRCFSESSTEHVWLMGKSCKWLNGQDPPHN